MFSTPVVVIRKSSEKILAINGPAQLLFGLESKTAVDNKHIKLLLPRTSISDLYGKESLEEIATQSGDLRATIKVSLYEEGEQERVLITFRPKIVVNRPSSTKGSSNPDLRHRVVRQKTNPECSDDQVEISGPVGFLSFLDPEDHEDDKTHTQRGSVPDLNLYPRQRSRTSESSFLSSSMSEDVSLKDLAERRKM